MYLRGLFKFRKVQILSGGDIDVVSGGALKLAGTEMTRSAVVAAGATTCTNPVTQAEGEAIQAKVNEIIAALKAAGIMSSS